MPGDVVAVVAPAGPSSPERLAVGVRLLESWGLTVRVGPHVLGRHPALEHLAGTDAERAADLRDAWSAPDVAAVWAARGGYGCHRLVDLLDWPALAEAGPRLLIGFSDVTALHEALAQRLGVVGLHAPVVTSLGESTDSTQQRVRRTLFEPEQALRVADGLRRVTGGVAEGVLVGGNARVLTASLGTPVSRPAQGGLVVLEDIGEPAYKLDGVLTQLLRAGWFAGVCGVVTGHFSDVAGTDVERCWSTGSAGWGCRWWPAPRWATRTTTGRCPSGCPRCSTPTPGPSISRSRRSPDGHRRGPGDEPGYVSCQSMGSASTASCTVGGVRHGRPWARTTSASSSSRAHADATPARRRSASNRPTASPQIARPAMNPLAPADDVISTWRRNCGNVADDDSSTQGTSMPASSSAHRSAAAGSVSGSPTSPGTSTFITWRRGWRRPWLRRRSRRLAARTAGSAASLCRAGTTAARPRAAPRLAALRDQVGDDRPLLRGHRLELGAVEDHQLRGIGSSRLTPAPSSVPAARSPCRGRQGSTRGRSSPQMIPTEPGTEPVSTACPNDHTGSTSTAVQCPDIPAISSSLDSTTSPYPLRTGRGRTAPGSSPGGRLPRPG